MEARAEGGDAVSLCSECKTTITVPVDGSAYTRHLETCSSYEQSERLIAEARAAAEKPDVAARAHTLLTASHMLAVAATDLAFLGGCLHEEDVDIEANVERVRLRIDVIAASIEVGRLT